MKKINANYFIRHVEIGNLIEIFFIMAVVSLLGLRAGLHIFDFPVIGNDILHIAHVLWGGLLMLGGLLVALVMLNKEARYIGAVMGGVGFGVFIDELGKFITHDNNYFFKPTFALIYVVFVSLILIFRMIEKAFPLSSQEYVVNAIELLKDAVVHDMDINEQQKALELLKLSGRKDPLVKYLQKLLVKVETIPPATPGWVRRMLITINKLYKKLIENKYFSIGMISYFSLFAFVSLVISIFLVDRGGFWIGGLRISAVLMVICVSIASWKLYQRSSLRGFYYYRLAVLIAIYFFLFFLMYFQPVLALFLLGLDLLTLVILDYLIAQEEDEQLMAKRGMRINDRFRDFMKLFVVRK
jgi:hypothetical protein